MRHFFSLTKKKLFKALWIGFLLLYVPFLVFLFTLAVITNNLTELFRLEILLLYVPLFSLALVLFILVLSFFSEYFEFRLNHQMFTKEPYNRLESIGFRKFVMFEKSFWKLYKEAYLNSINGYLVIADSMGKNYISFTVLTPFRNIVQFQLPPKYRELGLITNKAGILVMIPAQSYWTPGISSIQEILHLLTISMGSYGFNASQNLKLYERKIKSDLLLRGLMGGLSG